MHLVDAQLLHADDQSVHEISSCASRAIDTNEFTCGCRQMAYHGLGVFIFIYINALAAQLQL